MLSFDEFVAYCETLNGQVLPTAGKETTFTVNSTAGKVVFIPAGKSPQEPVRRKNTEAVLAKLAETGDYSTGPYGDLTRQASYILGVMKYRDGVGSKRLPAEALRKVTEAHVWEAVQRLLAGEAAEPFINSTKYDLLTDDDGRLPPKAVFGLALSIALGGKVVPAHFTGGEETLAMEILRGYGYRIVPKGAPLPAIDEFDDEFPEGMEKLRTHKRRERRPAAARAKKADYLAKHGVLACERCGETYTAKYGDASSACIEVHHHTLAVSAMPPGYKTKLEDLQCLCANCHRVVHHELRIATKAAVLALQGAS